MKIAPDKWPLYYHSLCLECKRGKYKKNLFSRAGQSAFVLVPGIGVGDDQIDSQGTANQIQFDEQFLQVSQFYVSTKKSSVQRKIFEVKLRGYDQSGKPFQLGDIQLDLSKYINKQREPVTIPFVAKPSTGSPISQNSVKVILSFQLTIVLPDQLEND
jgi:hypothetical protein